MKEMTEGKRRTIGFLINQFDGRYQAELRRGAIDMAEKRGVNLNFFVGGPLNSPYELDDQNNIIYDLAKSPSLDGIIISFNIAMYITQEDFINFIRSFGNKPLVSISLALEGIPSIMIDNRSGMKEVVSHLIEAHGYQRIAFLGGPHSYHIEAWERFQAYREVLDENHIPFDPDIVLEGDFTPNYGRLMIDKLMGESENLDIDAIACANDEMALSVYRELKHRGRQVPRDIAVTGFDDIERVRLFTPPFTTVHQPTYEMGATAVELILDQLDGKGAAPVTQMKTRLVVRESCGCFPLLEVQDDFKNFYLNFSVPADPLVKNESDSAAQEVLDKKETIINALEKPLSVFPQDKAEMVTNLKGLIDSLSYDIRTVKQNGMFNLVLNDILSNYNKNLDILECWKKIVKVIRYETLGVLKDRKNFWLVDEILDRSQELVQRFIIRLEASEKEVLSDFIWETRHLLRRLNTIYDQNRLIDVLSEELPYLDIKSCYLSLFNKVLPNDQELPERMQMKLAFDERGRLIPTDEYLEYNTNELIPSQLIQESKRRTLIFSTLYNKHNIFGYIALEMGSGDPSLYGILRETVSSSLQTANLILSRQEAHQKLESVLGDLKQSEEKYREMTELLPTIVVETDALYRLLFLNQAGQTLFGVTPEALEKGLSIESIINEQDRIRLHDFYEETLQGKLNLYSDFEFKREDGSKVLLLCRANPVKKGNDICGVRWSLFDLKPFLTNSLLPQELFYHEHQISAREREVLELTLKGMRNKEIGEKLFITEGTVKYHLGVIYNKIGVNNKPELFNRLRDYQTNRFGHQFYLFSVLAELMRDY